jgi:WD40 repeat protein
MQAHDHPVNSIGVEWVGRKVCSGGHNDDRVLCSSPDGTQVESIGAGTSRIVWISANPGLSGLVFASADGKVWNFDGALHELYIHDGVYRTAISPDGRMVGSGSFDGSLAVYDLAAHRLVAQVPARSGSIKTVAWVDGELWTSGNDDVLRRWQTDAHGVVLRHTLQVGPGFDLLQAAHGRWAASVEERVLVVGLGDAIELRLDLGRKIISIDLSPDLRYVAAGIDGEIVVIDLSKHALATLTASAPVPNFLRFVTSTELAFSEDFALKRLDVSKLAYTAFETDPAQ